MPSNTNTFLNITLADSIQLLSGEHSSLTKRFFNSEYCLWLGSAVSKSRYPTLDELLTILLDDLWKNLNHALQDDCPYHKTLFRIIEISNIDFDSIPTIENEWEIFKNTVIPKLCENYQKVLNESVLLPTGAQNVGLDILKIAEIYSDPTVTPDADHQFVALLAAEGFVKEIITTNWDPLLEDAAKKIFWNEEAVQIISNSNHFIDIAGNKIFFIIKIHGCARYSLEDPDANKKFLVYSTNTINKWISSVIWEPFRDRIKTNIRQNGAIFIGLSGHDFNIQHQHFAALMATENSLHFNPPKLVFSSDNLNTDQRAMLSSTYDSFSENQEIIESYAKLPIASKPLLGTLYVLGLVEKCKHIMHAANDDLFNEEIVQKVNESIDDFIFYLSTLIDAFEDSNERWRYLAFELAPLVSIFSMTYRCKFNELESEKYLPLYSKSIPEIQSDIDNLQELGLPLLVLFLAFIRLGEKTNKWEVSNLLNDNDLFGQFGVTDKLGTRSLLVVRNPTKTIPELNKTSFLRSYTSDLNYIIYTSGQEPRRKTTSPRRKFKERTKINKLREIWLHEVTEGCETWEATCNQISNKLLIAST